MTRGLAFGGSGGVRAAPRSPDARPRAPFAAHCPGRAVNRFRLRPSIDPHHSSRPARPACLFIFLVVFLATEPASSSPLAMPPEDIASGFMPSWAEEVGHFWQARAGHFCQALKGLGQRRVRAGAVHRFLDSIIDRLSHRRPGCDEYHSDYQHDGPGLSHINTFLSEWVPKTADYSSLGLIVSLICWNIFSASNPVKSYV